ncbi:helix-turn-helix transcriptional regulator [Archangium sp.]|uniref:helix-turn-helix transcriptional regulator n=1 Tax=Archangium sp. TaxID=1872627 RepID=UPI002D696EAC|nr:helix-turn-helix transcriptional regulator [Archangium sp.]HYO56219.1 helix-turn-helix transcriptional regulator [Archangium sp.]
MAKKLATRLGECARAARQRLNLTQEDVAERIGIATEVYGRLERGNMLPSVPTFRKLCSALALSADEALGLSDAEKSIPWTPPPPPPEASEPAELRRLLRRARQLDRNSLRVLSLVAAHLGQKG